MTISLTDNSPRIAVDFGSITVGQTHKSFTVSFEFFDAADLNVYINGTLKTLTTDYTVTGGNGSTGTISLSTAGTTVTDKVVITRDIALARTTDFPTSGPFDVTSLNLELDKFIAISADLKDQASRALQLTDFDVNANLTLPALNDRKGRVLAFNLTTGAVESGPLITSTQTVAEQANNIDTLAGADVVSDMNILATTSNVTNMNSLASISSDITSLATFNSADITTVAGIQANVTTVATNDANVTSVAGNATNINAVAGQTTNLQNVTDNLTAIQNAAQNATDASNSQIAAASSASAAALALDSFDDRYLGSKALAADANPTLDNDSNPLVIGSLYFNQSANEMRVYDGGSWIAASSAGGASLLEYKYTATAGQTTFTGADDASNTLSYTVDNLIVILNGIVLENGADYTASNGSSVVLATGAAVNDELNIIAFKSFTTADMVSKTNGGAFTGNVDFNSGVDVLGGALSFGTSKWSIELDSGDNDLNFKYNGTTVFKLASTGEVVSANDITAFGTP